jgi:hypothetical protein
MASGTGSAQDSARQTSTTVGDWPIGIDLFAVDPIAVDPIAVDPIAVGHISVGVPSDCLIIFHYQW